MQGFSFSLGNQKFLADLENSFSLAIPLRDKAGPVAYGMAKPQFTPFESGDFKASLKEGGALNCYLLSFYPHGSGTHTESLLHVDPNGLPMNQLRIPPFQSACLVTVQAELQPNGDKVVKQVPDWIFNNPMDAIVIRSLPNEVEKCNTDYSGSNPPYFDAALFHKLALHGVKHVLTDFPSVDREVDEGKLEAHKAFFAKRLDATITELIYVPSALVDGVYLLNLQYPLIETDAVPSQPILFACAPL
jgi:arylformamidase